MKKYNILLIACVLSLCAFGQPISTQLITPNKIWNIESALDCPTEGYEIKDCLCLIGTIAIKVGNIKTFNEKEYYELLYNGGVVNYVREEGKKVFFYVEECNKEYLMYDFDLNVGDEILLVDPLHPTSIFNQDNPCELTEDDMYYYQYKVIEVDSVEYNNVKRKMMKLETVRGQDIWVEGIGCMQGINYKAGTFRVGAALQLKDCYESNELIFVNEFWRFCLETSINNIQPNLITVFVDEQNILHITGAHTIPLTIYDTQGRRIQSIVPDSDDYKKNISALPKGVYIIANKEKSINFKIVIK